MKKSRTAPSSVSPKLGGMKRGKKVARRTSMDSLLLSADEKRQLILAHAAARRPEEPRQRLLVYGATAICLLFVVGVWISTIGSGIEKIKAETPPSTFGKDLLQSAKQIKNEGLTKGGQVLDQAKEQGKVFREEQRALKILTQELSKTPATSTSPINVTSTTSTP